MRCRLRQSPAETSTSISPYLLLMLSEKYSLISYSFVQNMPLEIGIRAASLDGDADRLVYFYLDKQSSFKLLDGDKIATLGKRRFTFFFAIISERLNCFVPFQLPATSKSLSKKVALI